MVLLFRASNRSVGGWSILVTIWKDSTWTTPMVAYQFDTAYSAADPFVTPDGSIFFISNRPRNAYDSIPDYDIWVVHPQPDCAWSKPLNVVEVNSDSNEYYVSLAANGSMYFSSNRPGGYGSYDIYVSKRVNGKYSEPQHLGSSVNSAEMEHDPLISADEQWLIFTAQNRHDGYGEADLYYTFPGDDQLWNTSRNLGKQINTDTYEYCPYLTPDLKYFFYSSESDVKCISTALLPFDVHHKE